MKKILLVNFALFGAYILQAQPWSSAVEQRYEEKEKLTFFDIQNTVNDFYSTGNFSNGFYDTKGGKVKAPGWKQFKRWEWYWDSRVNIETGEFPETSSVEQWKEYLKTQPQSKSISGDWQQMGPDQSDGGYAGIGRINCVTFHPSDTNTYWIGSPSGGLWRTTNNGQTWTVLTDQNDILGVSDIAVTSDYATSNTIYIATGDRDGGSVWTLGGGQYYDNHSIGVMKSTNGGVTWNTTGLNYNANQFSIIGRLLIDTTNNLTLFASTNNGIHKTTDGGVNWTKVLTTDYVIDMEFKPADANTIYASTKSSNNSKIFRSVDGGNNWTELINFSTGSRRTELAVSYDGPGYVYAIVSNTNGGLKGVYKSRDEGDNFEMTFDGEIANNYLLNYYSDGSGENSGQGNYDLAIAVAPNDTNTIYIGGINTWKSQDGGYTWTINNMWTSSGSYNFTSAPEVHADKHVLKYRDTLALFEGNDGGIYKSNNDGVDWKDLTNGVVISQFYRLGVSQITPNLIIGGLQDNGTKLLYTDGNWYDIKGGDGMECIIDPTNDNYQYGTYIDGEIERTTDGWTSGINRTIISDSIPDADGGWWVSPYMLDPNNTSTIYVGYSDVWKSTNRGNSFAKISTINTSSDLRSMTMSEANSDVLYVADQDNIWKTVDGGIFWTNITGTLPSTNTITYLYADPGDEDIVWVTFGGYDSNRVYESTDGGTTWTNISTGLPNLPVFSVVNNKLSSVKQLYASTDRGVFFKEGNANWQMFSTGLPNVMVTELEIYYDKTTPANSLLFASTFGRGLWRSDIAAFSTALGTKSEIENLGIKMYPNPTQGEFTIESNAENKISDISIFDLTGRLVLVKKTENDIINTVDLTNQPKGLYIVRMIVKGTSVSSKILVE